MRLLVLADTHLTSADLASVPAGVVQALDRADVVLHAGDVVSAAALQALRDAVGGRPFYAVLGNNDRQLTGILPESLLLDFDGAAIALVHDAGRREGRAARLHRRFPTAAMVVFGHSHVPCNEIGVGAQILFNPGSPTQRRTQPHPTIGLVDVEGGRVRRREVRVV